MAKTAGLTAYLDLATAEEHVFRKGDFYVIEPGAVYAQKSAPGTEILFIKVPVDPTPEVERGIENQSKDRTAGMARRDYFYDAEAPKPNSIRPAAAVALFDSGGNILLLRRKDNDKWTMPGGTLDFGESLTDSAIREAREENRASDSNHGSNRHIHRSPHFYRIQRQRSPPGIYIRLFRPD
jgi:8-oxo-dGTP diphosphatase